MKCFFPIILLLVSFNAVSQTTCESMLKVALSMSNKSEERMQGKETPTADDINYLISICEDAKNQLNRLEAGNSDKYVLNEYRFCMLNTQGGMAFIFSKAGLM